MHVLGCVVKVCLSALYFGVHEMDYSVINFSYLTGLPGPNLQNRQLFPATSPRSGLHLFTPKLEAMDNYN